MRRRRGPGRPPGHEVDQAKRVWYDALKRAQVKLERAERERDDTARRAIEHGLSVYSVGEVLRVDPKTAWRRYRQARAS